MKPMKRILSVDDEVAILRCFDRALTAAGYDITTTSDPLQALDIIRDKDFDLIMLDVRMPKTSGFEIYQQVKKKGKPVSVLFVTAYPASFSAKSEPLIQMWQNEFSDGNTDILYKPFDISTLVEKVDALIGPPEGEE